MAAVLARGSGVLRADAVSFGYGAHQVLHEVSITVSRGGLLGVLGPNGSGKTTLLKLLAGLLTPARGRITLDGQETTRLERVTLARRLAVVPQETQLAFDYTVLEIVLMGRYPHLRTFEFEGPADLEIARRMLAATGTAAFEHRMFRTLSGGEKQRVVIASALAQFETSADTVSTVRVRHGCCCSMSQHRRWTSPFSSKPPTCCTACTVTSARASSSAPTT